MPPRMRENKRGIAVDCYAKKKPIKKGRSDEYPNDEYILPQRRASADANLW